MIAGAAANLQGISLQHFTVPLTPSQIRALLAETGSPQLGNISQHIGPRPDLFRAISQLLGANSVLVDIRPRNFPNNINPKSNGIIPVAILSTSTFDATTVDPSTVRFGRNGNESVPTKFTLADIDHDGNADLILHFRTRGTGIQCGDTSATLTGATFGGQEIQGSDSVRTVACKAGNVS
jgi:hypothetical protein